MIKLPTIKVPHIKVNKTALIVAGAVIVLIALIVTGAVQKVKAERAEAARTAQVRADADATIRTLSARVSALEADNKALSGQAQAKLLACSELRRLDAIRTVTASVTVPAYCL